MLTQRMTPEYYQHRHRCQEIGFESGDLAKKHKDAVLAHAQTISGESIIPLGDAKFHVVSQSFLGQKYVIDIRVAICDCQDFPRIWLCKHLAAVQTQYPHISSFQNLQSITPQICSQPQIPSQLTPSDSLSGGGLLVHHAPISGSGM